MLLIESLLPEPLDLSCFHCLLAKITIDVEISGKAHHNLCRGRLIIVENDINVELNDNFFCKLTNRFCVDLVGFKLHSACRFKFEFEMVYSSFNKYFYEKQSTVKYETD